MAMAYRNINYEVNRINRITWAVGRALRARKVVSRSNAKVTGKYPSFTSGRMIQWESGLELDAMQLFDADPAVLLMREQPAVIEYLLNGIEHKHYPDLYIETSDEKKFIEIKTDSDAKDAEVDERSRLMESSLPYYGYGYEVLTESQIRQEPALSNAKLLLRYGRVTMTKSQELFIMRQFEENEFITWNDICAGKLGPEGKNLVCALILRGFLFTYKEEQIGGKSIVSLLSENVGG